jgi:hypothetical protein
MFAHRRSRSPRQSPVQRAPSAAVSADLQSGVTTHGPPTAAPSLASLDRRSIAVVVEAPGGERILAGIGSYEDDPDLGGVLRVSVTDDVAAYDLLFVAARWAGTIESGAAHDCDFLLRVR